MLSMAGEMELTREDAGGGSLLISRKRILVTLSPSKAGTPVSISYIIDPREKRSDRPSTGRARACSGDI